LSILGTLSVKKKRRAETADRTKQIFFEGTDIVSVETLPIESRELENVTNPFGRKRLGVSV